MKKRAIIIGGFQKAQALTHSLAKKGYKVTLINEDDESCRVLAELDGVTVIHGDGSRPYILDDADARGADVAIAMTRRDEDNLVICELCKKRFNINKTVALVSDPKKIDFFYKMGVDSVVCSVTAITNAIEQQAFMDEISSVIPISEGRIKIAQAPVSDNAPSVDKKLWELNLPQDVIIGCILRGDTNIVPRGDTRILAGDMLIIISSGDKELTAIKELTGVK